MYNKSFNFHMSLPCKDIIETRKFYEKELGFTIGRSAFSWFDVNIFNNQITFSEDTNFKIASKNYKFEDQILPTFHFGVIADVSTWRKFLEKFENESYFAIGTKYFLVDKKGEHQSFFLKDPNIILKRLL